MATLAFAALGSVAGGAVGGSIGASLGWMLGSVLGNLLFPQKVEGPRRSDLKLQVSEYGKPIAKVWGTGRLTGNVIDQTELQEHKQTSGGKGGPKVTNYTYSASFAILLCAGPIAGVLRIWADGRLIYDVDTDDEPPCTIYLGDDEQEPDPTLEAIHGVGNTPAYRGRAYVVFTDYMLTDFGDRIPVLEFEVYTKGGEIPWRVQSFYPWSNSPLHSNFYHACATYTSGVLTTVEMGNGSNDTFRVRKWDLEGNEVEPMAEYTCPDPTTNALFAVTNANLFLRYASGDPGETWYYYDDQERAIKRGAVLASSLAVDQIAAPMIKVGGYIYSVGHTGFNWVLCKLGYGGGVGGDLIASTSIWVATSGWSTAPGMGTSTEDEVLYLLRLHSDGVHLYKYDLTDLSLIQEWDATATGSTLLANWQGGIAFHVHHGLICASYEVSSGVYNVGLVKIDGDTLTNYGTVIGHDGPNSHQSIYLTGGLLLDTIGTYSLIPPAESVTLAEVVGDLSDYTSVGSYDVSELESDLVRWFPVGNQMTIKNAIEALRQGYLFDGVESDDMVKFRKRGATDSVVTIPESDLRAEPFPSSGKGDLLVTTRGRERGLPRNVTLKYIDVETDYQTGSQNSPRISTQSETDVTLDLAIGFTADEAKQQAWKIQLSDYVEREQFQWSTSRKYAWVEPCDVVTVLGRVIRVTKRVETPGGVIQWEGVLHRASMYSQDAVGAPALGFTEQTSSDVPVATECVLLDIPILSQNDAPFGFYAAMGPSGSGRWSGAVLFKSLDGSVYDAITSTNTPAIIGRTVSTDSLGSPQGSPTIGGSLGSWSGDTIDPSSICVTLTDPDAELSSNSNAALENGAGYFALSFGAPTGSPRQQTWELCQYRDATLVAPQTYILSGFKRGRKNTSTSGHATGDTFVLLSTVINVDAPESDLNKTLPYKAVTFGLALAETSAQDFYNSGLSAASFFETEVGHLPEYGTNPIPGSPGGNGPGLVPGHTGNCNSALFLNQCGAWSTPAGGSSLTVSDEGTPLDTGVTSIDVVGGGATATNVGHAVTINIPSKAPVDALYVTMGSNPTLTNERVLTAGSNITISEGAGSPPGTVTISASIPASEGGAMTLIERIVVSGSPNGSITFSGIPSGYKDLMIVFQARDTNNTNADGSSRMIINGDTTAANYTSTQYTIGSGATTTTNTAAASSSGIVVANIPGVINQANALASGRILIPNYAGTTFYKSFLTQYESCFNSGFTISAGVMTGIWKSTTAINSITISCSYTAFADGSTFSLYGMG